MRKRYLGPSHLTGKHANLDFSRTYGGIFCTPCVLFGQRKKGGIQLQSFVNTPCKQYARLLGAGGFLTHHAETEYHQTSVLKSKLFLESLNSGDISQNLNCSSAKQIEENRNGLKRVILAIEHHGRLGAPLRGHRDCGKLDVMSSAIDYNAGQFRATLQLMASCGDNQLKNHIQKSPHNNQYSTQVVLGRGDNRETSNFLPELFSEGSEAVNEHGWTVIRRIVVDEENTILSDT